MKENFKKSEVESFKILKKSLEGNLQTAIVSADKNLILSKVENFANDIKITILRTKNNLRKFI